MSNHPVDNEVLISCWVDVSSDSRHFFRSHVGIGSSSHHLLGEARILSYISYPTLLASVHCSLCWCFLYHQSGDLC